MRTETRTLLSGLLWTSPWWLGFLLLLAGPMLLSLYISFCDYPLLQPPVWVGADNYTNLARDEVFHTVLINTFIYAALAIPAGTVLAILLAVLLNQRVRGQAFFRACVFVPTIVPLVAAGLIWMWMYNPEYGLISRMAKPVGEGLLSLVGAGSTAGPNEGGLTAFSRALANGAWLDSPLLAMLALVLVSLWIIGSPVVIYLAGLQDIPETLYEAAKLDGANTARQFWHVTLPGLSPVILFNVIIGVITTLQIFALPYVMWRTRAGPDRATYFYTMYLFDNAFRYLKMGYASAMAWIQLLLILVLTSLVFLVSRKMVHYRGE